MKGFIYRLGTAVKEFGERMGRLPYCGFCKTVISLGLAIRDSVRNCPVWELRQRVKAWKEKILKK